MRIREVVRKNSPKQVFLKISQISQEKETPIQVFFCGICKIFKSTFLFTEHLQQLLLCAENQYGNVTGIFSKMKLPTVSVNQSLIMLIKLYLLTSTAQNKGEKLGRIPMLEYLFEKVNKVVGSRSAALFKKRLYHT